MKLASGSRNCWKRIRTAVGAQPHLLKVELLHTSLIGGNSGTLDSNGVLERGLGGVNSDLIIGLITVLNA